MADDGTGTGDRAENVLNTDHIHSEVTGLRPEFGNSNNRRVAYIYNEEYIRLCDELPKVPNRASMTHDLIAAYGLLSYLTVVNPRPAKKEEICAFHSTEYVECLHTLSTEEDTEKFIEEAETFGLTYDCPAYPGVYGYAAMVSGASVTGALTLMIGMADVAINWAGGWHHAKRDEAAGFCYLNDIVISILKLRRKFERVLYVDIDLHHGDGVEDAFCATSKVMTVSFHKHSPGFFPGTGDISNIGIGRGRYYTVNIPLKDSVQDSTYIRVFKEVMCEVRERFCPDVVVCQCGADGLAEDPMASYNLTPAAFGECIQYLLDWKKPLLLLGGGGYNLANTARCWAYLTGVALGKILPQDIPEHKWFPDYGPDYELSIQPGNRPDLNDSAYIEELIATVKENLENISC